MDAPSAHPGGRPHSVQDRTLTPEEAALIPSFLQEAATVTSLSDFDRLVTETLRQLFPHEIMICGLGYIAPENSVHTFRVLNFGFPVEYLHSIRTPDGGITSPIMQTWINTGKPQLYNAGEEVDFLPANWRERFDRFGLRNLAAHGLIDRRQRQMSYFNFCLMPFALNAHHAFLLEILIPSLHAALLQVIDDAPPLGIEPGAQAPELTERERELLKQLASGNDHMAIAEALGISEHTVRNHLRNLYLKLGVNKATQALEKAKRLHLIYR